MVREQSDAATWTVAWEDGKTLPLERVIASAVRRPVGERSATFPPIGEPPSAAPASTDLTPREIEVLRLLAGGSTIKRIADELFLSPRTVERHITTIYRKIGARGRVDATAYALGNGLAAAPRHHS
jgi:DNA-binding NarL/FixJ family response regulator